MAASKWMYACGNGKHGIVLETDLQRSGRWRIDDGAGQFAGGEKLAGTQDRPQRCPVAGTLAAPWHDPAEFHPRSQYPPAPRSDATAQANDWISHGRTQ